MFKSFHLESKNIKLVLKGTSLAKLYFLAFEVMQSCDLKGFTLRDHNVEFV